MQIFPTGKTRPSSAQPPTYSRIDQSMSVTAITNRPMPIVHSSRGEPPIQRPANPLPTIHGTQQQANRRQNRAAGVRPGGCQHLAAHHVRPTGGHPARRTTQVVPNPNRTGGQTQLLVRSQPLRAGRQAGCRCQQADQHHPREKDHQPLPRPQTVSGVCPMVLRRGGRKVLHRCGGDKTRNCQIPPISLGGGPLRKRLLHVGRREPTEIG